VDYEAESNALNMTFHNKSM